jgi:hypothetical protein
MILHAPLLPRPAKQRKFQHARNSVPSSRHPEPAPGHPYPCHLSLKTPIGTFNSKLQLYYSINGKLFLLEL